MFSQASVCLSTGGTSVPGKYPSPRFFPGLWSFPRGYPRFYPWSQVLSQGVPLSQTGKCPSLSWGWGGGTPVPDGGGVPQSQPGGDTSPSWGVSLPPETYVPPPRDRRASNSYAAGDIPLVVTQEDFPVIFNCVQCYVQAIALVSNCPTIVTARIQRTGYPSPARTGVPNGQDWGYSSPGQVTLREVCLVRFPVGLSCMLLTLTTSFVRLGSALMKLSNTL